MNYNEQVENLTDIINKYLSHGKAGAAYRYVDGLIKALDHQKGQDPAPVLLAYDWGSWGNENYRQRNKGLLNFYSLIEVCLRLGVIPNPLPQVFRIAIQHQLSHPVFIKFVQQHPGGLPAVLFNRVAGADEKISEKAHPDEKIIPLYLRFLDMAEALEEDRRVTRFDNFLGTSPSERKRLWDMVAIPEAVQLSMERIKPEGDDDEGRDDLRLVILGYFRWIEFIYQLNDLLLSCNEWPEIEEAFLAYHAYWFIDERFQEAIGITTTLAESHAAYFENGSRLGNLIENGAEISYKQELVKFKAIITKILLRLNIDERLFA